MAVKTVWPITFSCGHSEDRDLSPKRADQRAGYAKWLADKKCTPCWRGSQASSGERLSDSEFIAEKRAEEAQAAQEWESEARMPDLEGAEKALDWGRRSRHNLLSGAYDTLVMSGDVGDKTWTETIEERARRITSASWWIDNREADAEDVAELVQAATTTDAATSENPFA